MSQPFLIASIIKPMADSNEVKNTAAGSEIDRAQFALLLFGLIAPAITFAIAVSNLSMFAKTAALVGLSALYGIGWLAALRRRSPDPEREATTDIPLAPCVIIDPADEMDIGSLAHPRTSLPNERAFFVVLENQLAESARSKDERPLSILSIEIKAFDDICKRFGNSTGDRLLRFVAEAIASQLRKMDLITHFGAAEFNVVLPTANAATAAEIIARINDELLSRPFEASEDETIKVWLSFGTATFLKDAESADQLLKIARQRKLDESSGNVVSIEHDYVN